MDSEIADVEKADRIGRKRARMLLACGILFLTGQGIYFTEGQSLSDASAIKLGIWLIWALALLALLATGGGLMLRAPVRRLMNDEITRSNRLKAQAVGFWAACGSAILLYVIAVLEPVAATEAIHIVLTAAIGGALLTFGRLERRLHADG